MFGRRAAWIAGGLAAGLLPLLLAGADPLREVPALGRGMDPLLQSGILHWSRAHLPFTAAAWQAPIFHPAPWSLAFMDPLAAQALLVAPWPGLDERPALAYDLALFLSLAGGFWAAARLARRVGLGVWAALVAGAVYAAGPYAAGHYHHLNQVPGPWLPLLLGSLLAVADGGRRAPWVFAALLLLLPLWGLYATATAWLAVLALAAVLVAERPALARRLAPGLLVGGAGLFLAWLPYGAAARAVEGFGRGVEEMGPWSARPFDLWHPPVCHLLPWPAPVDGRPVLYLGLLAPLAAAAGMVRALGRERRPSRRRLARGLLLAGGLGLILSFGRHMPLPGLGETPLPLAWLQDLLPPLRALRAPSRFIVPAVLATAIFGAAWAETSLRRTRGFGRAGLILVVAAALLDLAPGRLQALRVQPEGEERVLLDRLAAGEGPWAPWPMPCSEAAESPLDARAMLFAAWTGRPVAGGASGYVPPSVADLRRRCCGGDSGGCRGALGEAGVRTLLARRGAEPAPPGREVFATGRWRLLELP